MKLLLIRASNTLYRYSNTSYGLGLVGTLAKEFAEVRILDNNSAHKLYSMKNILKVIIDYNPDIIGFNVNTFNIFETSKLVSAVVKHFPEVPLIAGGLHTYSEPKEVADLGVHIVVKGDAETTICTLLQSLQCYVGHTGKFSINKSLISELLTIPGLIFKDNENDTWRDTGYPEIYRDLDNLPFVDYDLFNLHDYLRGPNAENFVTNQIVTQRGCPYECPFCQGNAETGMNKFRENSAQYKFDYVKYLYEKYKVKNIMFHDNNFTLRRENTIEFCNKLIDSGMNKKLTFNCQTNVVIPLDDVLLQTMKRAGCSEVCLGVERLSQNALRLIKKNKNYDAIVHNIHAFKKHEMSVMVNCLVGLPFDNAEILNEEMRLFDKVIDNINTLAVNTLLPIPGTEIYKESKYKKWYMDEKIMSWKPSFYHMIYNFYNPAWDVNFFNLDKQTLNAIRQIKEKFYDHTIKKVDSRIIDLLHVIERLLGRVSLRLFRISPKAEDILFSIPKLVRLRLWSYFVNKYHRKQGHVSSMDGFEDSTCQAEHHEKSTFNCDLSNNSKDEHSVKELETINSD